MPTADPTVSTKTRLAAKRGFIRTSCQSLSAAIPTAGIALAFDLPALQAVGLGAASAIATATLAGAASYLSIIASGIPQDYRSVESGE